MSSSVVTGEATSGSRGAAGAGTVGEALPSPHLMMMQFSPRPPACPAFTGERSQFASWAVGFKAATLPQLWEAINVGNADAATDAAAKRWLMQHVRVKCAILMDKARTAHAAWTILRKNYDPADPAQYRLLLAELETVCQGPDEDVQTLMDRIMLLTEQLRKDPADAIYRLGVALKHQHMVTAYDAFTPRNEPPTWDDWLHLQGILVAKENRDKERARVHGGSVTAAASYAPAGRCYACGEPGHIAANCPKGGSGGGGGSNAGGGRGQGGQKRGGGGGGGRGGARGGGNRAHSGPALFLH